MIFFFAFPVSSGKFGKQSLRFRAAKTFFFGITVFLYQNQNPVVHLRDGRHFIVYYESIKRELKIRPIYECRCDERLQTKAKEFIQFVVYYESIKRELKIRQFCVFYTVRYCIK